MTSGSCGLGGSDGPGGSGCGGRYCVLVDFIAHASLVAFVSLLGILAMMAPGPNCPFFVGSKLGPGQTGPGSHLFGLWWL